MEGPSSRFGHLRWLHLLEKIDWFWSFGWTDPYCFKLRGEIKPASVGMWGFITPHPDSTLLSVFFYLTQQFSSRFKSLLAPIKYKMIISLQSMCILNANCEVSIYVPSLCTAKDFISLSIHFPCYGWILHFLSFTPCLTSFVPSSVYSAFSLCLCIFSQLPFSLFSHPALPFLPPLCWSYRRITLIDIAVCFRSRVDEEGALGRRVDLFSALVLVGGAYSWMTGPTQKNQILSSALMMLLTKLEVCWWGL